MKKLVRCKACGFIMAEGKYEFCVACNVPSKMFEPYEDKIPENRRKLLDLHMHGVIVHAPQGLGFVMLVLAAIALVIPTLTQIFESLIVMSWVLPITLVASIGSGFLHGKYRYKTLSSSLLRLKAIIGTLFLLLSIGMLIIATQNDFVTNKTLQVIYTIVNLFAFGCSAILGKWGASLMEGIMGGPFVKKKKATSAPVDQE